MDKEKILFLGLLTLAGIVMIIAANVINPWHWAGSGREDASGTQIIIQSPENLEIEQSNETVTATNSMNVVVQQGGQEIRNADVQLSQQVQLKELSEKQITKEHAIAIANATEEVQEFLKLYPDAQIEAFQDCCCGPVLVAHPDAKCDCDLDTICVWIVSYHISNWKNHTSVRIAINSTSGKILAKYPKLEYIKDRNYCESDEDCKRFGELPDGRCCGCTNFMHFFTNEVEEIKCLRTYQDCKCQNNTCTITEKT